LKGGTGFYGKGLEEITEEYALRPATLEMTSKASNSDIKAYVNAVNY
jgi:hypothetical protein